MQFSLFVCLSPSVFCETLCRAEIPHNTHGEMLAWFPSEHVMLIARSFPLGGNSTPSQSTPYTDKLEHTKVKRRPQKTKHMMVQCDSTQSCPQSLKYCMEHVQFSTVDHASCKFLCNMSKRQLSPITQSLWLLKAI